MSNPDMNQAEQDRVSRGQSIAKGDTGDGETGVPAQEPGISNRPGDREVADPEHVTERDDDLGVDDEAQSTDTDETDQARADRTEVVPLPSSDTQADHDRVRKSNDRDQQLEREGKASRHNEGYDEAADGPTAGKARKVVDEL